MSNAKNVKGADPLGLVHLGEIIEHARSRKVDPGQALEAIGSAYLVLEESYRTLRDRYILLKGSNRQLSEEVAWLRDQCDDFALERADLRRRLDAGQARRRGNRQRRRMEDHR